MATSEDKNVETVKLRRRPESVTAQELIAFARAQSRTATAESIERLLGEFLKR